MLKQFKSSLKAFESNVKAIKGSLEALYAQTLTVVNLIVVNFFGFGVITRHHGDI